MTNPESQLPHPSPADVAVELTNITRNIERADENENTFERCDQLDKLLEEREWLLTLLSTPQSNTDA